MKGNYHPIKECMLVVPVQKSEEEKTMDAFH